MKALLGGKGANLCEMARLGVNIPAGFTITTEVCQEFYRVGEGPCSRLLPRVLCRCACARACLCSSVRAFGVADFMRGRIPLASVLKKQQLSSCMQMGAHGTQLRLPACSQVADIFCAPARRPCQKRASQPCPP
jgi:hypothetical protein